jgi:hypothetical protein
MYTQINTLQGPLFLFVYGLLGGNIIAARSLSALFSLVGVLGVCLIAARFNHRMVALLSGIFLAFNFYFISEARLASMDMFASVLLIWAFFFLWVYAEKKDAYKKKRTFFFAMIVMCISGALFAAAAMTKLFTVVPLFFLSVYLVILWFKSWKLGKAEATRRFFILSVFALSIIATTSLIMSIYGFEITLQGIFLNNLSRPTMKYYWKLLMLLLFVGILLIPFIFAFITVKKFYRRREVHLLLIWMVPLLIMYIFQSLTWVHHYTIIAPPLCILGGWGIYEYFHSVRDQVPKYIAGKKMEEVIKKRHPIILNEATKRFVPPIVFFDKKRRTVFIIIVVFIFAMIISNFIMVLPVEKPVEYYVAEDLERITDEDDFIISGDPLITNYAGRLQVPEVANLAMVKYPPVTPEMLINLTEFYQVKAIVFTYNLSNQLDYIDYIQQHYEFYKAYEEDGEVSHSEGEIEINMDTFTIYLRPKDYSIEN